MLKLQLLHHTTTKANWPVNPTCHSQPHQPCAQNTTDCHAEGSCLLNSTDPQGRKVDRMYITTDRIRGLSAVACLAPQPTPCAHAGQGLTRGEKFAITDVAQQSAGQFKLQLVPLMSLGAIPDTIYVMFADQSNQQFDINCSTASLQQPVCSGSFRCLTIHMYRHCFSAVLQTSKACICL